jgi:hypothetical protein
MLIEGLKELLTVAFLHSSLHIIEKYFLIGGFVASAYIC